MNKIFEQIDKNKLAKMLEIKKEYSEGKLTVQEAKKRMHEEVGKISPEEFAAAEQLIKEADVDECRNEDVRTMLDIFDGLIPETEVKLAYGHPIDAYKRENIVLKSILDKGDKLLEKPFIKNEWLGLMENILLYKIHFSRKQNQLYSSLENNGFDRPTTTMWPYDDVIKEEMNTAFQLLKDNKQQDFFSAYKEMSVDLRDLMDKEEMILYPTSLKLISEEEFEEMKHGDREIGFFLIDMPELIEPMQNKKNSGDNSFVAELSKLLSKYGYSNNMQKNQVLDVAEGKLTLEQINLLFKHLPVDISFVDEDELVKFYTDTPHRVFPRSKGVIGREVRNCHPPKSVHLVEEIIEKFRSGEKDSVDFWINKPEVFIYIKYVAVRDEKGKFRGVLEMMQDCTHIRSLKDSRTLLTWDEENKEKTELSDERKIASETNRENAPELISPNTKLKKLTDLYPKLLKDLVKISPKFKMLQTPMAKVIFPIATIEMMSQRSEIPLEDLIEKISDLIESYKNIN